MNDHVLTVASYNVHRCIGIDQRHDPDRVAAVLAELGADVIGLQELSSRPGVEQGIDQLDYLAQTAGYTAIAGPTLLLHTGTIGNGILTRHPVRSERLIDLTIPGREPRGAIDVELDVGGRPVRVVNTHLGLRASERRIQMDRLFQKLPETLPVPLILLGDFNEWRAAPRALRMATQLFQSRLVTTFPSRRPFLALDRIFVRPRAALASLWAHRTRDSRAASDHVPVCARIELGPG